MPATVADEAKPLFRAAIEQAEAYHFAARSADASVSPLLFSYTLKQISTAIILTGGNASTDLATRHGISVRHTAADELPNQSVTMHQDGTYADTLAALGLTVTSTVKATTGALLAGNPDAFGLFNCIEQPKPVLVRECHDRPLSEVSYGGGPDLRVEVFSMVDDVEGNGIRAAIDATPMRAGWEFSTAVPGVRYHLNGARGRAVEWPRTPMKSLPGDAFTTPINHFFQLTSTFPGGYNWDEMNCVQLGPVSPTGEGWPRFIWWWTSMFALGSIVRYAPLTWTRATDLDGPLGADLREFIARAATSIPETALWAIRRARTYKENPLLALLAPN